MFSNVTIYEHDAVGTVTRVVLDGLGDYDECVRALADYAVENGYTMRPVAPHLVPGGQTRIWFVTAPYHQEAFVAEITIPPEPPFPLTVAGAA